MGYFFESREACYGRATVSNAIVLTGRDQIYQHLYNVVGGFVAILLPVFFEVDGQLLQYSKLPDTWYVAAVLMIFALALVGWIARPRQTLPLLAMVAGNALTMFLLYRTRNVLLGAAGVYLSAAVGGAYVLAWSREKARTAPGVGVLRVAGVVAALTLVAAVVVEGVLQNREAVEDYRASVPARFPCELPQPEGEVSDSERLYFDPEIVRAAREYYGQEPGCRGAR
jgi:cytochrome bd-type quinol oxidase subunit 2